MDKKISELTAATTVAAADTFVVVQGSSTNKVDATVLFNNVPVNVFVKEAAESPLSGALTTTKQYSVLTANGTPTAYTLAAGTHGMDKIIVLGTLTSGTAQVTITSGSGFSTASFDTAGESVHLKNIGGTWYVIGNNGVTLA
jgi:hypothetical protein